MVTNNEKIALLTKMLRNHGIEKRNNILSFGYVSRMDNLQAAILNLRFKKLNEIIKKRKNNAKIYFKYLEGIKSIKLPKENKYEFNTYHTFIIQAEKRDKLKDFLEKKGISTAIHYPSLIFQQKAYINKFKKININKFQISKKIKTKIKTLKNNQFLKSSEIKKICFEIKKFYK